MPNSKESVGTITIQLGSDIDHTSIEYYIEEIERVDKFIAKFNTIYSGSTSNLRHQKKLYLSNKARAKQKLTSGGMVNLEGLVHGKNIDRTRWIILVEGAADVGRLSQLGYQNTLEVGGARLDDRALAFARTKEKIIAFMDGDEEGIDNLRRLRNTIKIDEPLLADKGIEVENLPLNRIREILEPASKKMSRELL
ncbi:bacterial-type DNA primase [Cenarchaeum symbiosum A]|uniref:Bacterial-type DNA primase n=1 Tax=Cenarchaeum symbiosum (strain A) TaxID=414004 RepID=A0RTX6_CENSY|nr:bacterial-type DNA primase [Cenarchaeum symbiosum A]